MPGDMLCVQQAGQEPARQSQTPESFQSDLDVWRPPPCSAPRQGPISQPAGSSQRAPWSQPPEGALSASKLQAHVALVHAMLELE